MTQPTSDDAIDKLRAFYSQQIEMIEERLENQEGMIALLTQGFSEIASNLEAALIVIADINPEIRTQLEDTLLESKKKMFEVLNPISTED